MTAFDQIVYQIEPAVTLSDISDIKVYEDGKEMHILSVTGLGIACERGMITVSGTLDLTKAYEVEIACYGKKTVVPSSVFDSEAFLQNSTYDGDDLGASIKNGKTTFKLWAPTASRVVLALYLSGESANAYRTIEMAKGACGVWSYTEACGHGTYYTYTVTTACGTQTTTDPYARAAGLNGERGMVVDLSLTDPEGWAEDTAFRTGIKAYTDAVIWEVHVRDFSKRLGMSKYQSKYLAFTETGLENQAGIPVGLDYLKALGITHVHLLPIFDFATVDEGDPNAAYNWGYDPKNYNVPEGSYSTDPHNGAVRIRELKEMVAALHRAGIGVIMDVVYNHTYDRNGAFGCTVPYYYYRHDETGAYMNASGCGNDTASERVMFRKFMVDSVTYWAKEYHLDGFRFDLMGLHDLQTMQEIERAVHSVNKEALIYGEGWSMGATLDGSAQANQWNISGIDVSEGAVGGIAVFNDVLRDGLKGSVFAKESCGYISGAAWDMRERVQFGIGGAEAYGMGWSVQNAMSINYMSAHDNRTLWDKLCLSRADISDADRRKMNRLGAAILMISRGTPFMQAGEEMLRSKGGEENSYHASDEVNALDWETLTPSSGAYETMLYYKQLIAMRKAYPIFRADRGVMITFSDLGEGRMEVTFDDQKGNMAHAVINPTVYDYIYTQKAGWCLIATDTEANLAPTEVADDAVVIGAYGIRVYVKRDP